MMNENTSVCACRCRIRKLSITSTLEMFTSDGPVSAVMNDVRQHTHIKEVATSWMTVYAKPTVSVIRKTSPKNKRIYLIRVPQVVYLADELILKLVWIFRWKPDWGWNFISLYFEEGQVSFFLFFFLTPHHHPPPIYPTQACHRWAKGKEKKKLW